jgi:hypothetical protein
MLSLLSGKYASSTVKYWSDLVQAGSGQRWDGSLVMNKMSGMEIDVEEEMIFFHSSHLQPVFGVEFSQNSIRVAGRIPYFQNMGPVPPPIDLGVTVSTISVSGRSGLKLSSLSGNTLKPIGDFIEASSMSNILPLGKNVQYASFLFLKR